MVAALSLPHPIHPQARHYVGWLIEVPWQSLLVLPDALPHLGALLLGRDAISRTALRIVASFVRHHRLQQMAVAALALNGAQELGVTVVPQIRIYEGGQEILRHHGQASYTELAQIFSSLA